MRRSTSSLVGILVAAGACLSACSNDSASSASGGGGATTSSGGAGGSSASNGGSAGSSEGGGGDECGPGNVIATAPTFVAGSSPLKIARATAVSSTEILLTFTEPLAPTTGVDPSEFRLSVVRTIDAGTGQVFQRCTRASTSSGDGPYVSCCSGAFAYASMYSPPQGEDAEHDYTFYYSSSEIAGIEAVAGKPNELSLKLSDPLDALADETVEIAGHVCTGGSLYLHFAEGKHPIKDLAGHALDPIAPKKLDAVFGKLPDHPFEVALPDLTGICCSNTEQDRDESDVDCGGPRCAPCGDGKMCNTGRDCQSGVCGISTVEPPGKCVPSTCNDGTRGGDETGIDCGGSCASCLGAACTLPSDCASGACAGICVPPVVTAISAGALHSCAVLESGKVKCWGVLDNGTFSNRSTPVFATVVADAAVAVIAGRNTTAMSGTFYERSCAIGQTGAATCWSSTTPDSLGIASAISESDFGLFAIQVGNVVQWTTSSGGGAPVSGLGSNVVALSVGGDFACAITEAGGVRCWGNNARGQLGNGTTGAGGPTPVDVVGLASGVVAIAAGDTVACAIDASGGVSCWGANDKGQLGAGTGADSNVPLPVVGLGSGVTAITVGGASCAVTSAGAATCWGNNADGQVGDGTKTQRAKPVSVIGLGSGVSAISASGDHTCALTSAGRVLCWGKNDSGQLGDGTTTSRLAPVEVVGL